MNESMRDSNPEGGYRQQPTEPEPRQLSNGELLHKHPKEMTEQPEVDRYRRKWTSMNNSHASHQREKPVRETQAKLIPGSALLPTRWSGAMRRSSPADPTARAGPP